MKKNKREMVTGVSSRGIFKIILMKMLKSSILLMDNMYKNQKMTIKAESRLSS